MDESAPSFGSRTCSGEACQSALSSRPTFYQARCPNVSGACTHNTELQSRIREHLRDTQRASVETEGERPPVRLPRPLFAELRDTRRHTCRLALHHAEGVIERMYARHVTTKNSGYGSTARLNTLFRIYPPLELKPIDQPTTYHTLVKSLRDYILRM